MMRCKRTGKIEKDLTQTKTIHIQSTCCSFPKKKKKIKTFYHFKRLDLYFPDFFSGLENCWANVKTFLRLCTNPVHLWESALELKTRTSYGVTAGMSICCPSGERKLTVNQVVKTIVTYKPQKIAYHSIYFTLNLK